MRCLRCSHEWTARVERPCACPSCKHPNWDTQRSALKTNPRRRTFYAWADMMNRCYGDGGHAPHRYIGRGLTVCERWHLFQNFIADMGEKPEGRQIDRIDNNKGYSPENCRWVNSRDNNNNRSDNRIIKYMGKKQTASMWAREYGMEPRMLLMRLWRGWEFDRALNQVPRGRRLDYAHI